MPPHNGGKWPTDNGEEVTEVAACLKLFSSFKHPLMSNLKRRYQKYMNAGHKDNIEGGVGNLDQRVTMTEKLDWMMMAVL